MVLAKGGLNDVRRGREVAEELESGVGVRDGHVTME
jgi:hypothetical protein